MSAPALPALPFSHWHLAWSLEAAAVLYTGLYVWAAHRVRGRWPLRRTVSWLAAIACVLLALQSGLATFDERLLSAHMVQHMLLMLVAPLLILASQPVLLTLRVLPPPRRRALVKTLDRARPLTAPALALACFAAALVLTHLPGFYAAMLRHSALHAAEHALYVLAGLLLWWPILDVDPAPRRRLGGLGRLVYVLAAMPPMALVGVYLNRAPSLVYPAYGPPAHALGVSALADQQRAGAIMWVAGNMLMVAVGLWVALAALVAEERLQQARDARAAAVGAVTDARRLP